MSVAGRVGRRGEMNKYAVWKKKILTAGNPEIECRESGGGVPEDAERAFP